MKSPEQVKTEFTREWVEKAEEDFRSGGHLLAGGEQFACAVAFHAQQAAEKYVKALLVWHQVEFPKTHDIALLLGLASGVDPAISETLADAADLTRYGAEYRYPGDYPDVTLGAARGVFDLAERVRTEIRRRLPAQVLEGEWE